MQMWLTRGRAWFWGSVAVAVPISYASLYVSEGGPPPAEGCSGAGSGPAGVSAISVEPHQQVDSDAFVAFTALTSGIDAETAFARVAVSVHDETGAVVQGTTVLLREPEPTSTFSEVLIGWSADTARAPGETLTLTATATNDWGTIEMPSTLVVTDTISVLELPSFLATSWQDTSGDWGPPQACTAQPQYCISTTSFGTDVYSGRSAHVTSAPTAEVAVAWEYRFENVTGKGTFVHPPPAYAAIPGAALELSLDFADVLDEYCVRIVGRDLRTDDEQSREWCARPSPPSGRTDYDTIVRCEQPPPGFEERWCRSQQGRSPLPPSCEPPAGTASGGTGSTSGGTGSTSGGTGSTSGGTESTSGGTGSMSGGTGGTQSEPGSAGEESGGTSASGAPIDEPVPPGDDSTSTIRTNAGCGCRTSRDGTSWGAALLGLLGLFATLRRKRGQRP